MNAGEVAWALGIDVDFIRRLVADGVIEPSGGGGGARGRRRRWHDADLGLLLVCEQMRQAGAGPDVMRRAVTFLRRVPRVPYGFMLLAGPTFGPRLVSRETLAGTISAAGEACIVLDLTSTRRLLNQRPAVSAL